MERTEIETQAKDVVVEHLGCDPNAVTTDANFVDDLGADSLDIVELVMAFEEQFSVQIEDDAAEKINTFGDAVDLLVDQLVQTNRTVAQG
jgi:acyl carrier protein